jgi:hypothetical protein
MHGIFCGRSKRLGGLHDMLGTVLELRAERLGARDAPAHGEFLQGTPRNSEGPASLNPRLSPRMAREWGSHRVAQVLLNAATEELA